MRTDTWMPVYVGDYLADTQRLTTEQHGAYLLLLLDYWRNGPPPENDEVLCSITRLKTAQFRKHKSALLSFFTIEDGKLIQKRVERERERATGITEERSRAGKAGAAKRWGQQKSIANAIELPWANAQENDGPSQLPSVPTEQPGVDPKKRVFDQGIAYLVSTGSAVGAARSIIGKWRKSASDERIGDLIDEATRQNIADPKAWITAALNKSANDTDIMLRSIERTYGEKRAG